MKKVIGFGAALALLGCAGQINVMTLGVGTGRVQFSPAAADCGPARDVCQLSFSKNSTVTMTATPSAGDTFAEWGGNCSGSALTCSLSMSDFRAVTARFEPSTPLPMLAAASLTGPGVQTLLSSNPGITWTPEKFLAVLNAVPGQNFKTNWILMSRSESLQTAHATSPRLLLPNGNAQQVFAFSLSENPAWPGARPEIVEYMQWDAVTKRFRFHEIDLAARTVSVDEPKCVRCHAGRPNWDAYDSWGGMLPFNRDRVYKGSLEAAALRNTFRLWSQTGSSRAILEQLALPTEMVRNTSGGYNNGRIAFPFDDDPVTVVEPVQADWGVTTIVPTNYPSSEPVSNVFQGGEFFTIHANPASGDPDEGRGVSLFDRLTALNALRIAQQLIDHPRTVADVRPIALAIFGSCDMQSVITPERFEFFNTGSHAGNVTVFQGDTSDRRHSLPARKADTQLLNLSGPFGLWTAFSATIEGGGGAETLPQLRRELFRREPAGFRLDTITGRMIDREDYLVTPTTADIRVMQLRFFLEPLGVPVDKWSLSVGGRSRTYTFADVFSRYVTAIQPILRSSLGIVSTANCPTELMSLVQTEFNRVPDVTTTTLPAPAYAEVQAVFDRNCLQCHGNFTVNGAAPVMPNLLPANSFISLTGGASPAVLPNNIAGSRLWQRITGAGGVPPMPPAANGPPLSGAHIRIIERWIAAGAPSS
jgi:mono/diheme cytochrome c family protein